MEADFLKTLNETRLLEHAISLALEEAEGNEQGGPATRQGFLALQRRVDSLKASVDDTCSSLEARRRQFAQLHSGWRVSASQLYDCTGP